MKCFSVCQRGYYAVLLLALSFYLRIAGASAYAQNRTSTVPVNYNGKFLGTVSAVMHTDGIIEFRFSSSPPGTSLSSLLASLGCPAAAKFTCVQFVTSYNGAPLNDANGHPIPNPPPAWVDPPSGGLGAPDTRWADTHPWYWNDYSNPKGPPNPFSDPFGGLGPLASDHTIDGLRLSDMADQPVNNPPIHQEFDTFLVIDYGDGTYDVIAGFHWGGDFGNDATITENRVLTAGNTLTPDEQSAVSKFLMTLPDGSTAPYTNRHPVTFLDQLLNPLIAVPATVRHGVLVIDNLTVWNVQGKL